MKKLIIEFFNLNYKFRFIILFVCLNNFILIKNVNALYEHICKCIIFNSTYDKEFGIFHSPDWPTPYEDNINCLLYTFHGNKDQIIEITFDEFDIQKTNLECIYRDYIKLYLNLPDNRLYENTSYNQLLCGKISDIEQTHYSSHSTLIFDFHSDWRSRNNTGFSGTFRFLNKKMFLTDGLLLENTICDYVFNNSLSKNQKGKFFSPFYPSTYPKNSRCKYKFIGNNEERVKVIFEYVNLQKADTTCLSSADQILIYDGLNRSAHVIGHLCNQNSFLVFTSTFNSLYLEFNSRSLFPGQGFRGTYLFEYFLFDSIKKEIDFFGNNVKSKNFTSVHVKERMRGVNSMMRDFDKNFLV